MHGRFLQKVDSEKKKKKKKKKKSADDKKHEILLAHQIGIFAYEIILSHIPMHSRSRDPYVSLMSEKSVLHR